MKNLIIQDSKTIVDSFFEMKLFKESITRDDMDEFQEFIRFSMESKFNTYIKLEKLKEKLDEKANR